MNPFLYDIIGRNVNTVAIMVFEQNCLCKIIIIVICFKIFGSGDFLVQRSEIKIVNQKIKKIIVTTLQFTSIIMNNLAIKYSKIWCDIMLCSVLW